MQCTDCSECLWKSSINPLRAGADYFLGQSTDTFHLSPNEYIWHRRPSRTRLVKVVNEWGQWMLDLRNSTHALLSDAASQPQAQLDVEQAKKALKTMREVDEEVKKEKAILVFRQKKLEEEDEDSDVAYARKEAAVANWVKSQRMYKGRKPAMARGDPNSNRMKKKMKKKEKKAKKSQDADPSSNKDNVSDMPSISQGSVHQEPGDHHQDGDEKDDEEEENQGRTHRRSRTHESTQVHSFQNV